MKGTALFRHLRGKGALHLHRQMLKPQKSQQIRWCAALLALMLCMLLAPETCLPLCMVTPLFACLLPKTRYGYIAWAAVVAPMVSGLMAEWDVLYAASLMLPCALSLLVTLLPEKHRAGTRGMPLYLGASTLSLTLIFVRASQLLGGSVAEGLTDVLMAAVQGSDRSSQLLLGFVQSGLIAAPKAYEGATLSPFGMDPVLKHQLLLALRFVSQRLLQMLIPQFFVQGAVLSGLFTMLRVRRVEGVFVVLETHSAPGGQRTARVAIQPGFRFLGMPASMGIVLAGLWLVSLPLLQSGNSLTYTLSCLFSQMFVTCFAIQGAAALVCAVSIRHPDRLTLAGGLAAALYVVSPLPLVLAGVAEQLFHYREKLLKDQKKNT